MLFIDTKMNEMSKNFVWSEDLITRKNITVVGIGALVLNGLSTRCLETNLGILTRESSLANYWSGIYRYIYIPEYERGLGFSDGDNVPCAERAICDYLKYRDFLPEAEVAEAIEMYEEDPDYGDIEKIVKFGMKWGISEKDVRQFIYDCVGHY